MRPISPFSYYLRTGRRLPSPDPVETKFNPWHDSEDGKFTFEGRGGYFGGGRTAAAVVGSGARVQGAIRRAFSPRQEPERSPPFDSRESMSATQAAKRLDRDFPERARRRDIQNRLRPVRAIPDFPETGRDSWRAANDDVFKEAAAKFNREQDQIPGDPKFIDPQLLKAWAMVESGGTESAFVRDPFQVNVPGDWVKEKHVIAGLSQRQAMTPRTSADAALLWLDYKGHIDLNGKMGPWLGSRRAFQNYHGRTVFYDGVPRKVWYANEVARLYHQSKKVP